MQSARLEAFDEKLARSNMRGQWKSEGFLNAAIGGPRPAGAAAKWSWRDVVALMDEAGEVMTEAREARRALMFHNPGLQRGATHTINMGVQMIMPGETAWAHRHSIAAIRFIIAGDAALTSIIDGEHCVMEDFDLVLTPNWSWHDHHNKASKAAYWLDVLDVPLVLNLNQTFYEPGSGEDQPDLGADFVPRARLRFPWRETEPLLARAPLDPHDGHRHDYLDPATGGPTLPTLSCHMLRLPPGFEGAPRRRSSSAVYFVARGAGALEVGGERLEFQKFDSLVAPNFARTRFSNASKTEDALLFSVEDTPVLRALGLYREA
jgi:1-hydroxy-2-naphthoate dioxygenase